MVITQPAMDVLSYDFSGRRLVGEICGRARRALPWLTSADENTRSASAITDIEPAAGGDTGSSEATPLVEHSCASARTPTPLNARERRSRAAAVRGLMHARQCRFLLAQEAFAEGLVMDPGLDLVAMPTFWDMPRGGQEAAVRAYEQVGRIRDAATIRRTFTPRAVPLRRPIATLAPTGPRD